MLKNNHGVTIVALVITIIVMLILTGVSITVGSSTIDDVRIGKLISNMILVEAKVQNIAENYSFYNNDLSYLIGDEKYKIDSETYKLDNVTLSDEEIKLIAQKANVTGNDVLNWEWYKWDSNTLQSQGLDKTMLKKNEYLYINYDNIEIISSTGVSNDDTSYFYSMTGLKSIYNK